MSDNDPSLSVRAGSSILLLAMLLFVPADATWAAERTLCGVRDGTAGNASLTGPDGSQVIELAKQGGNQRLLAEADRAVGAQPFGERGTQNGARYCLRVRFDGRGRPVAVLAGRRAALAGGGVHRLTRMTPAIVDVRAVHRRQKLTQEASEHCYGFTVGAVRDWDQERYQPDQASRAYLLVIEQEPGTVQRALEAAA